MIENFNLPDQKFLEIHDFDREPPYNLDDDWMLQHTNELYQHVERFLRDQSGRSFTTKELIEYAKISRTAGLKFLRSRDDVEPTLLRKDGYVERWVSHAEPLEPTQAGLLEEMYIGAKLSDKIGRGARADFYWTQRRGRSKRRNRNSG